MIDSLTPITDYWSRVDIGGTKDCWPWTGKARNYRGCGVVSTQGYTSSGARTQTLAHRVAYHLYYGTDITDWTICHACDNPACCNPLHLWKGTQADNLRDMSTKKRGRNGNRIIPVHVQEQIPVLYAQGLSQREVGERLGISKQYVSKYLLQNWP